jgi:5-methyltetrahydropteroyltriglutamate--homocysteine methyltransferase
VNTVRAGVDVSWALHVCYGNRYARPLWEGHYDFLFPAVLSAHVGQLVLEFARKGPEDLRLFGQYPWDRGVGLAVIDVKSAEVESEQVVADRIRRGLEFVSADPLTLNPDCGLRHLPTDVARAKLRALVKGAQKVRTELSGDPGIPESPASTSERIPLAVLWLRRVIAAGRGNIAGLAFASDGGSEMRIASTGAGELREAAPGRTADG